MTAERRRYRRLDGTERSQAMRLAAALYVKPHELSIESIVAEFELRQTPISYGTVRALLLEAAEAGLIEGLRPARRRTTR